MVSASSPLSIVPAQVLQLSLVKWCAALPWFAWMQSRHPHKGSSRHPLAPAHFGMLRYLLYPARDFAFEFRNQPAFVFVPGDQSLANFLTCF
jgi:hypothetical protein